MANVDAALQFLESGEYHEYSLGAVAFALGAVPEAAAWLKSARNFKLRLPWRASPLPRFQTNIHAAVAGRSSKTSISDFLGIVEQAASDGGFDPTQIDAIADIVLQNNLSAWRMRTMNH